MLVWRGGRLLCLTFCDRDVRDCAAEVREFDQVLGTQLREEMILTYEMISCLLDHLQYAEKSQTISGVKVGE